MLPWKRHKFELAAAGQAEEPQPAPRCLRPRPRRCSWPPPGGPAPAAPASPPPPPPPSRPPAPAGRLGRVGRLFRWRRRRQSFGVSREAPSFSVLYLGSAATLQAKGEGCTEAPAGKIWARSQAGRLGTRARLTIGPQGIRLAPQAEGPGPPPGHLYLLHRVTACAADARLPRLFAWVYRHEVRHKAVLLRCHAVLASRAGKARAMARLLLQTSAAALADFRRLKKRADARRQRLLPPPARGPGDPSADARRHDYKPPVERSRSAPRLGAIAEDALGEEREARRQEEQQEEEEEEGGEDPPLGRLLRRLGRLGLGSDPREDPRDGLPRQSPAGPGCGCG